MNLPDPRELNDRKLLQTFVRHVALNTGHMHPYGDEILDRMTCNSKEAHKIADDLEDAHRLRDEEVLYRLTVKAIQFLRNL